MYSNNKLLRDVADVAARIMSGQQPVTEKLHPNQQKLDVHEPEKDELTADDFKKLRAKKLKEDVTTATQRLKAALDRHVAHSIEASRNDDFEKRKVHQDYIHKIRNQLGKLAKNEEVEIDEEQLDELSPKTLGSYVKKATSSNDERSISNLSSKSAHKLAISGDGGDDGEAEDKKSYTRSKGIARAVNKLTKEEAELDEEQLDELSKDTLASYEKKSRVAAHKHALASELKGLAADPAGSYAHKMMADKRHAGWKVAVKKLHTEEVESIDEGRPSQQHPLEGHDYHRKTNAELEYIAKDAHRAAEAMKSHNTTAENKYRDQASDSATVRHFRKTSGTPDWYKKKYGHVKEAVEPKDNKPPFEGPYKKAQAVVTDKSGAKHGSMSRARDLAKQAAKRQAGSMKEEKQKSRKAQIIKNASKGNDKFEKDPIITDTTVKTDNLQ